MTTLLIDNSNLAVQAFFGSYRGSEAPIRSHQGVPTNALATWSGMIANLILAVRPSRVVFVLDGRPIYRLGVHPGYKANRAEKPAALVQQLPMVQQFIETSGCEYAHDPNEEADDLIASLADDLANEGEVVIASSDKDFAQCVTARVSMVRLRPKQVLEWWRVEEVIARFGVRPSRVAAWLALVGDRVDNIPGIPLVAEVRAKSLLSDNPTRETLLARLAAFKKWSAEMTAEEFSKNYALTKARIIKPVLIRRGSSPSDAYARMEALGCEAEANKLRRVLAAYTPATIVEV